MPPRIRSPRIPTPPVLSVAAQLQQLSSSCTASWFHTTAQHCQRSTARLCQSSRRRRLTRAAELVRTRLTLTDCSPLLRHSVNRAPVCLSSSSAAHFSSFSRSSTTSSSVTAGDGPSATTAPHLPLPRLLSPARQSASFSFRDWLSRKFGYEKYRPVIKLYAATSEQARSPRFANADATAVPVCASTACALLTLHMWILHSRMRVMAASAWKSGREADSKQLHANTRLLFNLAWQEMEHILQESDQQQRQQLHEGKANDNSTLPSHYTSSEYRQLSYGAMVSYDRGWSHYRDTGQRTDLMGALWRNIWTTATPLQPHHLATLATYVEHAIQHSNQWTEHDINTRGAVHWPTLQRQQQQQADEAGGGGSSGGAVWYDSAVYDGSRVAEGESVGVPVGVWQVGDEDLLLVRNSKSRRRLEGQAQARKKQQLSQANNRSTDGNVKKDMNPP